MVDDKEAKLAAAKKRAAELKAAKKKQGAQVNAAPDESEKAGEAPGLSAEAPEREGALDEIGDTQVTRELEELRRELDQRNQELADARSDLKEATQKHDKQLTELKKGNKKELLALEEKLEAERSAVKATSATSLEKDTLSMLEADLQTAKQASSNAESKVNELQAKNNSLQTENRVVLAQLTKMRERLMQLQDEKLALVETVERLRREAVAHTSRASQSYQKLSKEFDRTAVLQDVSLEGTGDEVPEAIRQGIQIDLTGWYDKHAGVVIEV